MCHFFCVQIEIDRCSAPHPWTPEDEARLPAMTASGIKLAAIAEGLKRTEAPRVTFEKPFKFFRRASGPSHLPCPQRFVELGRSEQDVLEPITQSFTIDLRLTI